MNDPYYPTPAVVITPTVPVQGEPAFGPAYTEALLTTMAADATHNNPNRAYELAVLIEVSK